MALYLCFLTYRCNKINHFNGKCRLRRLEVYYLGLGMNYVGLEEVGVESDVELCVAERVNSTGRLLHDGATVLFNYKENVSCIQSLIKQHKLSA